MKERRSAFKILIGRLNLQEKTLLGRSRRVREDNIRMNLKEISFNMKNGVHSALDIDY